MSEQRKSDLIPRSDKSRREANERREADYLTIKKLFHDYGVEEERKCDLRRTMQDRREQ